MQAEPRGFLNGWHDHLVEQEAGDSKRLSRRSLAAARNTRVDLTGGIYGRTGITVRAPGLWSTSARVWRFTGASREALLACDGQSIRVLEYPGPTWTQIGTFTNPGTVSLQSFAALKARGYLANGVDAPKVVDYAGGWNVRDAGVQPPAVAPTMAVAGPSSGPEIYFRHAYSHVDDRGFESNVGPMTVQSARTGQSFTMSGFAAPPANVTHRRIYSTLQNQQELWFVATIPIATASYAYDIQNLTRDTRIPAPVTSNTAPPSGIRILYEYRNRLYGAGRPGLPSSYFFSRAGSAEYWPPDFAQDTSLFGDSSDVLAFASTGLGLECWKAASALLLEEDPEFTTGPRPMMQAGGLAARDAVSSLNGLAYILSQRGIIAHDGEEPDELWQRIVRTSGLALQAAADRVLGAAYGVRSHFFFRNPEDLTLVRDAWWDQTDRRWHVDDLAIDTASATVSDSTRDFSTDSHVAAHENVENGAQTIASGGGTTTPVLSGTNGPKLVPGAAIKFNAVATIFIVEAVTGQQITISGGAAPADGTAVEWIRGTQVKNGVLTLYGV